MKRAFVTGATGFIGQHLLAELVDKGISVVAGVRRLPTKPFGSVTYVPFDLEHPATWDAATLDNTDCVFHLAARVHVMRPQAADNELFERVNVTGSRLLAQAAAARGVRRFVYLSSIKVNGEQTREQPYTIRDAPAPQDEYGRSKLRAELVLGEMATHALQLRIVRPPLVYGPGVGANFRRLMSWVQSGRPLPFACVNNRRSLVNVWNLVDLLLRVAEADSTAERIWLVSDCEDVSTKELVQLISAASGCRTRLWKVPLPVLRAAGFMSGRSAEIARLVDSLQVDTVRTTEVLGWLPRVSLREGIARTVAWFTGLTREQS